MNPILQDNFHLKSIGGTRRNIITPSALLNNNDRSLADEYTRIPHIYEPLNKLLSILLPHLKFERVDISDTDYPKCIFSKDTHSDISHPQNQVDIDELSRGEIEVISQFLPLVEHQILRKLVPRSDASSYSDIVVINGYARPISYTSVTIRSARIR